MNVLFVVLCLVALMGAMLANAMIIDRLESRIADLEFVIEKHQTVLEHLTEGIRHEHIPQQLEREPAAPWVHPTPLGL